MNLGETVNEENIEFSLAERDDATRRSRKRKIREEVIKKIWFVCAIFSIIAIFFIVGFLLYDAAPAFFEIGIIPMLSGNTWDPTSSIPKYGMFPLIVGTILVTVGSMIFAVPLGLASAVYIAELASHRMRRILKPLIELLSGIPSVVYGFLGLSILVKLIQDGFSISSGESILAGSILLGIMSLPTIISISEDSLSSVPRYFKEGSLALGATHWQTISRVLIPSALSGITAAIILGIGRAVGETMAVLMVTGNSAIIPDPIWDLLSPVRTLTGTLGIEMGETAVGSLHYHALFAVAVVLLAIALLINLSAAVILKRIKESQTGNISGRFSLTKQFSWFFNRVKDYSSIITAGIGEICAFIIGGLIGVVLITALILILYYMGNYVKRQWNQKIAFGIISIMIGIVVLILLFLLFIIFSNGLPGITWTFLTDSPKDLGRSGGIFPAIVGTFYLIIGSILIALPLGIGAAIYLVEYTRENALTKLIRTVADLLNGTPSIVFGLFGFTFMVMFLGFGISMISGMITLALMVLPTVIRTTEEALKSVPDSMREGSLALGATRWQTIRRVVIPPALPGIITGAILSIGRAAGETAPIMFTAVVFSQRYLPKSIFDPVMALPYHLYILATNVPGARPMQYATASVLLIVVIIIYGIAIAVRNHFDSKVRW